MEKKMYIICVRFNTITIPLEVYMDEDNATKRLYLLRENNSIKDRVFSLQYAPLMDGEI